VKSEKRQKSNAKIIIFKMCHLLNTMTSYRIYSLTHEDHTTSNLWFYCYSLLVKWCCWKYLDIL